MQINNIMDQIETITVQSTDIYMLVIKYSEQPYINIFGNLLSCVLKIHKL